MPLVLQRLSDNPKHVLYLHPVVFVDRDMFVVE